MPVPPQPSFSRRGRYRSVWSKRNFDIWSKWFVTFTHSKQMNHRKTIYESALIHQVPQNPASKRNRLGVSSLKPAPIAQNTPQTKNIKTQPNSGSKQHDIHVDLLTTGRSLLWMGPRTSRFQFCSPGQMPYGWRSTPIKTLEQIRPSGWPSQNEQNYQELQADFRAVSEEIEAIQTFHRFLSGEKG